MTTGIEVLVNGRWLSLEHDYGDVEMSTCWPGGSDEMSWSAVVLEAMRRFRGNELVVGMFAGTAVWSGYLLEPDASQDRLIARGAWHEAEGFTALNASGGATLDPQTAMTEAIGRGLRWNTPVANIWSTVTDYDVTQGPLSLAGLFDTWSVQNNERWGVDPLRYPYNVADPTTPSYQTLPLAGGMGYARDNYASTLVGRYRTARGYATVTVTDANAELDHGHIESIVDLTPRGVITSGKATTILTNMLALGRAIPQWTTGIEVVYGELLNMGGVPVALETVSAGKVIRAHGGYELAQRLNGRMYVDIVIGRTTYTADGTLVIEPAQLADRMLAGVLTRALDVVQTSGADGRPPKSPSPSPTPIAFGARQRSTQQSISNNTVTTAVFGGTKETATGISWDSGNDRWVVATAGMYHVVISILWDPNGTGRRNIHLVQNGADYVVSEKAGSATSTGSPTTELICDIPCEAGDTLQAQVFQNSGVALNVGPTAADGLRHFFSVRA